MPRGTDKPGVFAYQNLRDTEALFFSLERASFCDPVTVSETVSVEFPATRNMKDALYEEVLRRFVHKPYSILSNRAPIREELSTDDPVGKVASGSDSPPAVLMSPTLSSANLRTPRVREGVEMEGPYFIVHVHDIRVLAETVQQANDRGELRIDVALTLELAKVQYGMLFGVAEVSEFDNYFSVRVPLNHNVDNVTKVPPQSAEKKVRRLECSNEEGGDALCKRKREKSPNNQSNPNHNLTNPKMTVCKDERELCARQVAFCGVKSSIEVLVRRQSEEPVVARQVILLIVEPGCIRCMGIRSPRDAPGPFRLVVSKLGEGTQDKLTESKRRVRTLTSPPKVEKFIHRTVMDVVCDIPAEIMK